MGRSERSLRVARETSMWMAAGLSSLGPRAAHMVLSEPGHLSGKIGQPAKMPLLFDQRLHF